MPKQVPVRCKTIDLSTSGVAVLLPNQLQPGTQCRIEFNLFLNGDRRTVAAVAVVTRCICSRDGFKTGLQFIRIDEAAKAAIEQFVSV